MDDLKEAVQRTILLNHMFSYVLEQRIFFAERFCDVGSLVDCTPGRLPETPGNSPCKFRRRRHPTIDGAASRHKKQYLPDRHPVHEVIRYGNHEEESKSFASVCPPRWD
jgi:hypothetical protein